MRLAGRRSITPRYEAIGEASTAYLDLKRDEHGRCGIDPQLPSGTECGRDGKNLPLRPKAELESLPKKLGDGLQLDLVPHRPPPSVLTLLSKRPGDVAQLDPVPQRPAQSIQPSAPRGLGDVVKTTKEHYQSTATVQPSLLKKQEDTRKTNLELRPATTVVQPSLPKMQGDALKEDQEANIFNRTALRDWFWEHKGLSLDI